MDIVDAPWSRWIHLTQLDPKSYTCGYCGTKAGTTHGYSNQTTPHNIYVCTNCGLPTLFFGESQVPGADNSLQFKNLPKDIKRVYKEITSSIQNSNYTAAVLLARKLLMHVAVEQGDKEGRKFVEYVQYLADKGFVPPNADKLLTFIRNVGNQKNHEIKLATPEEAKKVLKFVESILQFAYELPAEFKDTE